MSDTPTPASTVDAKLANSPYFTSAAERFGFDFSRQFDEADQKKIVLVEDRLRISYIDVMKTHAIMFSEKKLHNSLDALIHHGMNVLHNSLDIMGPDDVGFYNNLSSIAKNAKLIVQLDKSLLAGQSNTQGHDCPITQMVRDHEQAVKCVIEAAITCVNHLENMVPSLVVSPDADRAVEADIKNLLEELKSLAPNQEHDSPTYSLDSRHGTYLQKLAAKAALAIQVANARAPESK